MLTFLLGALLLLPAPARSAEFQLEEAAATYGSIYFHGRSCRLYKCRFPALYQAHQARVELTGEALTLHLEKNGKPIFPSITVPRASLLFYEQEMTAPHEGYELERAEGPRKLLKKVKAKEGFSYAYYLQPVFGLRVIKFKQKKEDLHFDYGVELSYGARVHRVFLDPSGKPVSETVDYSSIREVENQYLVNRAPEGPGV